MLDLQDQFGEIDIYLFDQLLRGRISRDRPVLDAGCGSGRNLVYLLRSGYEVLAADAEARAVEDVRGLAAALAPILPAANFRVEPVEAMSFPEGIAGTVIISAVLRFARDDGHFDAMLRSSWRALGPGGLFFCRLASSIGMEDRCRRIAGRGFLLPDGSERYLVDEPMLMRLTEQLRARLLDPLKTTLVQDRRCMTTWVLRK
jgi:SAM-dependent methyltransferase